VHSREESFRQAGCLRDVIENHLFQVVALFAMEPPPGRDFGAVHSEKAKVFQAMRPLKRDDLVRGQYTGYRKEPGVAKNSDVETFCALRLFVDSRRSVYYCPSLSRNPSHHQRPRKSRCGKLP